MPGDGSVASAGGWLASMIRSASASGTRCSRAGSGAKPGEFLPALVALTQMRVDGGALTWLDGAYNIDT